MNDVYPRKTFRQTVLLFNNIQKSTNVYPFFSIFCYRYIKTINRKLIALSRHNKRLKNTDTQMNVLYVITIVLPRFMTDLKTKLQIRLCQCFWNVNNMNYEFLFNVDFLFILGSPDILPKKIRNQLIWRLKKTLSFVGWFLWFYFIYES